MPDALTPLTPAVVASRRHLCRIGVRVSAVLILLYALRELLRSLNGFSILYPPTMTTFMSGSLGPFIWFLVACALIILERGLIRWLVPAIRPGCPVCGYDIARLRSPICPECGTNLRPASRP